MTQLHLAAKPSGDQGNPGNEIEGCGVGPRHAGDVTYEALGRAPHQVVAHAKGAPDDVVARDRVVDRDDHRVGHVTALLGARMFRDEVASLS